MTGDLVQPGDVWRDIDPRGGPTFRVVRLDAWSMRPRRVYVTDLEGKRFRSVPFARFRHHSGYRSGYVLVSRDEGVSYDD